MSTSEAKIIVQKFVNHLKGKKYPLKSVYLFGSYARGNFHKWSDIDVAVVSTHKRISPRDEVDRSMALILLSHEVNNLIEPHYFTEADFNDDGSPLAYEIRQTGIKIV